MKDILENDESPLDECIACGAMGEWYQDADDDGTRYFCCEWCGKTWAE